jgi:SAM-dependent methyltransferase
MIQRKFNVSDSTNEVFSDTRHAEMGIDSAIDFVNLMRDMKCKPKYSEILDSKKWDWSQKVVLDAGCGGGMKTNAFSLCGAKKVIGYDASKKALSSAAEITTKLNLDNIDYIEGFLEDLEKGLSSYNVDSVDYILCSQVIHHTEDWKDIISQFSNLLPTNGLLQIIWLDPSLGVSKTNSGLNFILKNRLAFYIGNSPKARALIGYKLFKIFDEKYRRKWNISKDSFYADWYAAYYRWIPLRSMKRVLKANDFKIVESYPAISIDEYYRQQEFAKANDQEQKNSYKFIRGILSNKRIKKYIITYAFFRKMADFVLRAFYFLFVGGTERSIIAIKL